jgi:hypothetical protein
LAAICLGTIKHTVAGRAFTMAAAPAAGTTAIRHASAWSAAIRGFVLDAPVRAGTPAKVPQQAAGRLELPTPGGQSDLMISD